MNDNDRNDGININDNNRSNRLKSELAAAVERRKTQGQRTSQARAAIVEAKRTLKRTPAYQALKDARTRLKLAEAGYIRACDTIFGITDEILNNGVPGLPLFGRSAPAPISAPTPESGPEPAAGPEPPSARRPGRPRKDQTAGQGVAP